MKAAKICLVVLIVVLLAGCAHYSVTAERTEEDNAVTAPIDVVWTKTLELLPLERISITYLDKNTYTIKARKSITLWSWGDNITIKLFSRSPNKTIIHIEAHPAVGTTLVGWGHQERMTVSLFEKIKTFSESK